MRKLNYFIVGLSQLIMGTMTIGFVSCEQNLEALDNSPQMAEAMVGSKSITSNDSICLFSNTDSLKMPIYIILKWMSITLQICGLLENCLFL